MRVRCEGCGEEFASTDDAIVHVEDYPSSDRCTYDNMSEVVDPVEAYNREFQWLDRRLPSMPLVRARAALQLIEDGRNFVRECEDVDSYCNLECIAVHTAEFVRYLLEEADLL